MIVYSEYRHNELEVSTTSRRYHSIDLYEDQFEIVRLKTDQSQEHTSIVCERDLDDVSVDIYACLDGVYVVT